MLISSVLFFSRVRYYKKKKEEVVIPSGYIGQMAI